MPKARLSGLPELGLGLDADRSSLLDLRLDLVLAVGERRTRRSQSGDAHGSGAGGDQEGEVVPAAEGRGHRALARRSSRALVRSVAIEPRAASPTAAESWIETWMVPEARPASCGGDIFERHHHQRRVGGTEPDTEQGESDRDITGKYGV